MFIKSKLTLIYKFLVLLIFPLFVSCSYLESRFSADGFPESIQSVGFAEEGVSSVINMAPVNTKGLNIAGTDPSLYFVHPESGKRFTITPKVDSNIWYLYSSTLSNADVQKLNGQNINASLRIPDAIYPTAKLISSKGGRSTGSINPQEQTGPLRISAKLPRNPDEPAIELDLPQEDLNLKGTRNSSSFPTSPSDDYVGRKIKLYEAMREELVDATCVLKRTCDTAYGERTLVIYVEDGMNSDNLPTPRDYQLIADIFLSAGEDNDIYDKLTTFFGSDWGYFTKLQDSNLIAKDNIITLFYADIDGAGDPDGQYIGGYYYPVNNFVEGRYPYDHSNQRAMITLHAYASGGSYLGEALTTLSHEFQHLIHRQHISGLVGRPEESSSAMDECFASLAETLTADFIAQKTGQVVPGPFYIGAKGRTLSNLEQNNLGYLPVDNSYYFPLTNTSSRAPSFLKGMNQVGFLDWNDNSSSIMLNYGIVASFADWLLVNYGAQAIRSYMAGGYADLVGLANAINRQYTLADTTPVKLIADWGTAVLLSDVLDLNSPYSFNKEGWYEICGMRVPSIDFRYHYNGNGARGVISLDKNATNYVPQMGGNGAIMVYQNVAAGSAYTATAPILPYGMMLTVVAVPK